MVLAFRYGDDDALKNIIILFIIFLVKNIISLYTFSIYLC